MNSTDIQPADLPESRLDHLRRNPDALDANQLEDLYEDLEVVDAALADFRDRMDDADPTVARLDAALGAVRNESKTSPDFDSDDMDDHAGAFEWRQERKAEVIKVLKPALALLDELQAHNHSGSKGE